MLEYGKEYFTDVYDVSGEGAAVARERGKLLLEKGGDIRRVLDVGCGFGDFLEFLERKEVEVAGVDISSYALEQARKKISGELHEIDIFSQPLPFPDKSFDAVGIFDVVEHLSSPKHAFLEIHRVLRPGGLVFVTTPNDLGVMGEALEKIFPTDPTHINVQGKSYWREWLDNSGFSDIEEWGCVLHGFPPLPALRRILERIGVPVVRKPIFIPLTKVCGTLYFLAKKA